MTTTNTTSKPAAKPAARPDVATLETALLDADGSKLVRRLDRQLGNTPKPRLHADELTPRDMKRARALLGRDPYEMLSSDDNEDRMAFVIWCLLSRDNPSMTLEDALDTPLGMFDFSSPPPTPEPATNGNAPSTRAGRDSGTRPTGSETEHDAAPTSA